MKREFRFKKSMGQNFLRDSEVLARIADVSGATETDGILEIGPGDGALSVLLAPRVRKLICVELDKTLIKPLSTTLALYPNARIVQGDILKQDLNALGKQLGSPCRVVANLPYNITTAVLEYFLLNTNPFQSIALMVQKEAGERMMAKAGENGYGPLSILVSLRAKCQSVLEVPSHCFYPMPHVDSIFLYMDIVAERNDGIDSISAFYRFLRQCFAMRRKTLLNNLASLVGNDKKAYAEALLESADIKKQARPEEISLQQFILIYSLFRERANKETMQLLQ